MADIKIDYDSIPRSYRDYPVLQKHASQSAPWVYFNKAGKGETGRGHNV